MVNMALRPRIYTDISCYLYIHILWIFMDLWIFYGFMDILWYFMDLWIYFMDLLHISSSIYFWWRCLQFFMGERVWNSWVKHGQNSAEMGPSTRSLGMEMVVARSAPCAALVYSISQSLVCESFCGHIRAAAMPWKWLKPRNVESFFKQFLVAIF